MRIVKNLSKSKQLQIVFHKTIKSIITDVKNKKLNLDDVGEIDGYSKRVANCLLQDVKIRGGIK